MEVLMSQCQTLQGSNLLDKAGAYCRDGKEQTQLLALWHRKIMDTGEVSVCNFFKIQKAKNP